MRCGDAGRMRGDPPGLGCWCGAAKDEKAKLSRPGGGSGEPGDGSGVDGLLPIRRCARTRGDGGVSRAQAGVEGAGTGGDVTRTMVRMLEDSRFKWAFFA